jgi:2-oxoglutarate ferredoxin oxidoreductase subunit alpha
VSDEVTPAQEVETLERLVLRFAGDSGDGMQLAGTRFTDASALFGNDLATLPNYPAEIRAPAGTIPGVSSFQVQISERDILTPGDSPDVLIAMNPAALKANLGDLRPGGLILVNSDAFDGRNLEKAGYETNPLEDGSLKGYSILTAPMEELTKLAVADSGVTGRATLRSKNFFALGLVSWMFTRPLEPILEWIEDKFGSKPEVAAANTLALKAGWNFGLTTEAFHHTYEVRPAKLPPGEYTNVEGNRALAWGFVAAAQLAKLPLFYGSYPITPASTILEELAAQKHFGVRTLQAEDEIAGVGVALGAAYAGHLAVTGTSGPGLALKSETISLGVMTELPLVVVNVQRGGPSTGLPTKTEQSDLLFSVFGRHGESPLPIVAAATPSDAFDTAIEASRIALKFMTPVILMTDGYIANSSEPWLLPDIEDLPDISVPFSTEPNGDDGRFLPYKRDPETLSRGWATPGTPGMEHHIGGLEKDEFTGNVSYVPANHEKMVRLREAKVARIADFIPDAEVDGPDDADLLVIGWGSTYGAIKAGVRRVRNQGMNVAHLHLRYIHPFQKNLGEILNRYPKILVPELNRGQLAWLLQAEFLTPIIKYPKIQGLPFKAAEIEAKIMEVLS